MKKYKVLFADLDGTLIETLSGNTFPERDLGYAIEVRGIRPNKRISTAISIY